MLLALLILYGQLNWMIIDRYMYGPRQPPHRPNPQECGGSTFLPQEGPAWRQAGVLSCTGSKFTLAHEFHKLTWMKLLFIILTDTCKHLLAPPPSQSPESAEAPLSSPRKSRRQSWPRCSPASVQFNSASWYLWAYFIAKIMDYTRIWTITWTCTHPPQRLTNPLRVQKLHFPPLGEASAEVYRHTTHAMV